MTENGTGPLARVGVIGAGYVGLVTGVCLASLGCEVTLRDIDAAKVAALNDGQVPIYEPGLAELMAEHADRLAYTLSLERLLERSDIVFIAVDTPPTYSGDADLSRVMGVIDELERVGADARHVLVMKSTVPVGTGERVRAELDLRGLDRVGYCSNPEFLKEGAAIADFLQPDRVVIGAFDPAHAERVAELYAPLDTTIVRTSVPSAEMVKYASNAFLATKISFINEIANVCEEVGADVDVVAHGMGLDRRIGPAFLRAGIGFGGSCLVGAETVLVRQDGAARLTTLADLLSGLGAGPDETVRAEMLPDGLEVLSWSPGDPEPTFRRVAAATRRPFHGEVVEVATKLGRTVRATPDHPFVTRRGDDPVPRMAFAAELGEDHWLPIALGAASMDGGRSPVFDLLDGLDAVGLRREDVIVRPAEGVIARVESSELAAIGTGHARGRARVHDVIRSGALRLPEADLLDLDLDGATVATARNGTHVPVALTGDPRFWRIAGLYAAEGHCTVDGRRHRLTWSFHPNDEMDLVADVAGFWRDHGVKVDVRPTPTSMTVTVSSRILAGWWLGVLGLGADCYRQRVPDALWTLPEEHRRAFLAGAWRGDGSWSRVAGGPSVVLEYGTVSRALADGMLRLLGGFGIAARLKVGRPKGSTVETFWIVVSAAHQVESLPDLVPEADRETIAASLGRLARRIAPTGCRRAPNAAWVRVRSTARRPFRGAVYSLEVPGADTFVTTGGLVVHNCFPKDVSALKQLAGNSGYHFQLLTSVIEVNELQKRRVIGKLKKHLGALEGKRVALLGLTFKPETDDMREASSLVLAARLLAEGAEVTAYDPVVNGSTDRLHGVALKPDVAAAVAGADAVVLVTEWRDIVDADWADVRDRMRTPVLIDGRNALDPARMTALGFAFEGIGRIPEHVGVTL
ncbi:MAG: nucleotide sugar dehydrogenase [Thermoleophilia bacterium]